MSNNPSEQPRTLLTGLVFGESPRWRDGRLWLTDMSARELICVDLAGQSELIASILAGLSGIGFCLMGGCWSRRTVAFFSGGR